MEMDGLTDVHFHVGPIVCGPVSVSKAFNQQLKDINRKVLAIETESGGIFKICNEHKLPAVTIRGISDLADGNKRRLESTFKESLRALAMDNAISFFRSMLNNIAFMNVPKQHAASRLGRQVPKLNTSKPEATLNKFKRLIDDHLMASSLEYKTRPLDAPLPLPRLRRVIGNEDIEAGDNDHPISISEALVEDRRLYIKVPRAYPEKDLAWLIALSLFRLEMNGKQLLPIVIDGARLVAPSRGIRNEIGNILDDEEALINFSPVILIHEPVFDSSFRMKFATSELRGLGDLPLIVVSKAEFPVEAIDTFKSSLHLADFLTASMPLADIAGYLEKAFEMTPEHADVVAARLDDTFSKFRLNTHPAYFIGLQEATLVSLIEANQRAELIQLAVDGILSFAVAADRSDLKLTRTTREEFLTELAFCIRVEKRGYTKGELVNLVETFADDRGLEIDSFEFLNGFFEFGLLTNTNGKVSFSLPFVEAYLLANRLIKEKPDALRYFCPDQQDFDFYAFDIYCERGPSSEVVSKVLSYASDSLSQCRYDKNIIETKKLKPRALQSRQTLVSLAKRMGAASEKISAEPSSVLVRSEKQRLVDAREAVRTKVDVERDVERSDSNTGRTAEIKLLDDLSRSLTLAATLMGSGSERLSKPQKLELGRTILAVAERFLHYWTEKHSRIDFTRMRQDLLSEESVKHIADQLELYEDGLNEVRDALTLFIDDQGVKTLGTPLATIAHRLSSYAGVRSLKPILLEVKPQNPTAAILRASWMMDVDPENGRKFIKGALKDFNDHNLLRFVLANHIIWRIFWHHWQSSARFLFADVSKMILKPMGILTTKTFDAKVKLAVVRKPGD